MSTAISTPTFSPKVYPFPNLSVDDDIFDQVA